MDFAGEFKNALGCGCFASVNVRENTNVSVQAKVRHGSALLMQIVKYPHTYIMGTPFS
jgi:hypothetical protein